MVRGQVKKMGMTKKTRPTTVSYILTKRLQTDGELTSATLCGPMLSMSVAWN